VPQTHGRRRDPQVDRAVRVDAGYGGRQRADD
jgi:hypothetical protein